MDPNELARIKILHSGMWIKGVIEEVIQKYHVMAKLYKSGTSVGSGAPENYTDWMNGGDSYLNGYTK